MTLWYIARGAGLSALILLTVATCLGAVTSGRVHGRPVARINAQYLHRAFAFGGLAVLGVHVIAILADSYAHVGWLHSLIPFTSQYRPLWVGIGTLALYAYALVAVSGMLRARLATSTAGARGWRILHGSAYAGWALSILHGLKSGTDSDVTWVRFLYLACLAAVVGSVAVRMVTAAPERRTAPTVPIGVTR
ncbi:MAG TPA: hypothetical protein VJ831_01260 [Jatrophihabitantaceae bacterium]|nr:hypothetical protein [Jatrophihabitantaceae bacterium]